LEEQGIAQQLAAVTVDFELWRTGRSPDWVTVVISGQRIVITLEGILSVGETFVSKTSAGAAAISEFHQLLFETTSHRLRDEVARITGLDVVQLNPEASTAGAIVPIFATGAVVLVIHLAGTLPAETWSGLVR
jgi:uncharacterized protein YbcI